MLQIDTGLNEPQMREGDEPFGNCSNSRKYALVYINIFLIRQNAFLHNVDCRMAKGSNVVAFMAPNQAANLSQTDFPIALSLYISPNKKELGKEKLCKMRKQSIEKIVIMGGG